MDKRMLGIAVTAVCLMGVVLVGNAFALEKVAYVDLASVFDGYEKTKDYDVKLEGVQKTKQEGVDKKVKEIKELQDKLAVLSDKEKEKVQGQIDTKTQELQEFQREAEMELLKNSV